MLDGEAPSTNTEDHSLLASATASREGGIILLISWGMKRAVLWSVYSTPTIPRSSAGGLFLATSNGNIATTLTGASVGGVGFLRKGVLFGLGFDLAVLELDVDMVETPNFYIPNEDVMMATELC